MGLRDIFLPKWKNSDPVIREQAIESLNKKEVIILIARSDESPSVRKKAISKINDQDVLCNIAKTDKDEEVRAKALNNLSDQELLYDVTLSASFYDIRLKSVDKLSNHKFLEKIIMSAEELDIQLKAVHQIDDQHLLGQIAMRCPKTDVGSKALKKISDVDILEKVSIDGKNGVVSLEACKIIDSDASLCNIAIRSIPKVSREAVKRIKDQNILLKVVQESKDIETRQKAIRKVEDEENIVDQALSARETDFRVFCTDRLKNQASIKKVFNASKCIETRMVALQKLDDDLFLANTALNDTDYNIISMALTKISDVAKVMPLFEKAASEKLPQAELILGILFVSSNQNINNDIEAGLNHLRNAAQQGYSESIYKLGLEQLSEGVDDSEKDNIIEILKIAAENGYERALEEISRLDKPEKQIDSLSDMSFGKLYNMAKGGLPDAQYIIAVRLSSGEDIRQDIPRSVYWMKRASDKGHEAASAALLEIKNGLGERTFLMMLGQGERSEK